MKEAKKLITSYPVECTSAEVLSTLPENNRPQVEEGKTYWVEEECVCDCGEIHYNIGLRSNLNFVSCHKCNEVLPKSEIGGVHWAHSSRFKTI